MKPQMEVPCFRVKTRGTKVKDVHVFGFSGWTGGFHRSRGLARIDLPIILIGIRSFSLACIPWRNPRNSKQSASNNPRLMHAPAVSEPEIHKAVWAKDKRCGENGMLRCDDQLHTPGSDNTE